VCGDTRERVSQHAIELRDLIAAVSSPPDRRVGQYTASMTEPLVEPPHLPPATEQQVRSQAARLVELAAEHGITDLAFASPGRLRGRVGGDRDLFDMFEFQRAASDCWALKSCCSPTERCATTMSARTC
jgi:hypothetical protein